MHQTYTNRGNTMKIRALVAMLCLLSAGTVYSATDTVDVDQFMRTVNLTPLIHTDTVVNLHAQMKDPDAFTTDINDLTDFVALTTRSTGKVETLSVEFDNQANKLEQKGSLSTWIGVLYYKQNEIPALTLQDGFTLTKSCIAKKTGRPAPLKLHRVTIYKTIQYHQMVYDYVVEDPLLSKGVCQEILYTPDTADCELGMHTNCHLSIRLIDN